MADRNWLDGFEKIPGNDSGTWLGNVDAPKIVLHTTEGPTAAGAYGAFRKNNSWPHVTVDPKARTRAQHVPLDRAARALRNTSTPGQTNRDGRVYQVEIVGFAGKAHDMPDDQLDWLGTHVLAPLAAATGTPLVTSVQFFGADCGWTIATASARQRLSPAEFDAYRGVLGHQHVPENTHWDPGALDVGRILWAAAGTRPADTLRQGDRDSATDKRIEFVQAMLTILRPVRVTAKWVQGAGARIADPKGVFGTSTAEATRELQRFGRQMAKLAGLPQAEWPDVTGEFGPTEQDLVAYWVPQVIKDTK